MRVLGLDVGERRIGVAISDPSRTLARPLSTMTIANVSDGIDRVVEVVSRLQAEDDGLRAIVVGVPSRLDGSPTTATAHVLSFIDALKTRTSVPIATEGERLTSVEAESRLASRERDWRKRKNALDAEAAAIILQDYLDRGSADTP